MVRHPWPPGQAITVIGAAHLRQGTPCQDASLCRSLRAGSEELQLLAVADGHGGRRYWLSDVGSAIACSQAEWAVQKALEHTPLADRTAWLSLLRSELPNRINAAWLEAVEMDWKRRAEAEQQPFSTLPYGCTLGLVVVTPQWWGCSGIGDWDLAAITAEGTAQLLSEERDGGHGEATGSLCQPIEQQQWAERAQLQPLSGSAIHALVLSTDGVRKSCATDADYLNLCSALIPLSIAELQKGLQQITAEGSGDDVSVAMVRRPGIPATDRQTRRAEVLRRVWVRLAALALLAGAGLLAWRLLQRPTPLDQLISELCREPSRIRPTLLQRRAQFTALLLQPALSQTLQAQAATDPLGALIADGPAASPRGCTSLQLELQRQWREARKAKATDPAKGKMPATAPSPP